MTSVEGHFYGAMVGALHLAQDGGRGQLRHQTATDKETVDAPANVAPAGLHHITPPGIGFFLVGMKLAKCVNKAAVEEFLKAFALGVGGTGRTFHFVEVTGINGLVNGIEIAAYYHRLAGIETNYISAESLVPLLAVMQARKLAVGIGRVDRNKVKIGIFKGYYPAFVVMFLVAYAAGGCQGFMSGIDGSAGIAFAVGEIPERLIALKLRRLNPGTQLGLLKADKVGIKVFEYIAEAFAEDGAQAVDVP